MSKAEWGVKRVCPTTGKRFYDLNKSPIISPYSGEVVSLDGPKTRMMIAEKTAAKDSARAMVEIDEDVILDEDAPDVELDDDLLEADDDDNVSLDELAEVEGGDEEP